MKATGSGMGSAMASGAPIRVRLFAGLREEAGWAERELPLAAAPTGFATAEDLWRELGLGPDLPATVRIAINRSFANADQPLQPGDELAFLPPISGG
ncbi:MAG: MoaD/ThiS family protein [Cyanobacteriota bacterium]|jgi:molybdopterin synthase sulfur carrier subunit